MQRYTNIYDHYYYSVQFKILFISLEFIYTDVHHGSIGGAS